MKYSWQKRISFIAALLLGALCAGCAGAPGQMASDQGPVSTAAPAPAESPEGDPPARIDETEETYMDSPLRLYINDTEVSVTWEDNESVAALMDLASSGPFTVRMSMYGGFEQVGSLGTSLPENDVRTTTQAGDIVLYAGSRIVIFYGSNSWAYTRLGRITDKTARELAELLGSGDVSVTLTVS